MQSDNIKLFFTYGIAVLLILGGLIFLYATRSEPGVSDTRLAVVGFIGIAVSFVFNDAANTRGQRSFQAGVNTPGPGSTTVMAQTAPVTSGGPTTVTNP